MKRILLPVLVIGVLLLGACGAPPAETPPPPPPAEEPVDYTAWIAIQLKDLNQAMINFVSFDSSYAIHTRVYSEEQGEVLVHEFNAYAGNWYYIIPVNATALTEAKTHIDNAYCLTNEGKLPGEVWARDVSPDEIAGEVSQALTLLDLQVSSSYSWQEDNIQWIMESTSGSPGLPPDLQPNKEKAVQSLTEVFDDYREELSKMVGKLELVLSRLTGTATIEG